MAKIFMGVRLRALRQERGLTQVALAQALGISPSYLNQLEQDQRPFTVSVLLKVHRVLGVDIQQFSEDEQARLVAQLSDAVAAVPDLPSVPQAELRELAAKLPQLSQTLLAMHRRHQQDTQRLHTLADRLSRVGMDEAPGWVDDALPPSQMPFEAVRDVFFARRNYFDSLDRAAEALAQQAQAQGGALSEWLTQHLRHQHGVFVLRSEAGDAPLRRFDAASRTLHLSADLQPSQQAFQLATQLALLELQPQMQTLLATHHWQDEATRRLASIGLANYVAGALILPYGRFLQAAESLGYDIELLGQRFGVGYEMGCHRLSTLQRCDAPGVPFFFIRVDRAGNISKRHSATDFHFSQVGGSCPLWIIYEAFNQPGRILTQVARMPDGRRHFWLARQVSSGPVGHGQPRKTFAVALGCELQHADRLVYARGLDTQNPSNAVPIGPGCRVCPREDCMQRAFAPLPGPN